MHTDDVVLRLVEEDMIIYDDEDRRRRPLGAGKFNPRSILDRDEDDEDDDEEADMTEAEILAKAARAAR